VDTPSLVTVSDPANKSAIKIRQVTVDDHRWIAELEARYSLETESYEQWAHLWVNNPAFHEFPDWPIGWVLENEDNETVGHIGNVPLLYEFKNQRLLAGASRAVVVDTRYRSYSFQLFRNFFKQKSVNLFLATTVNEQATKANQVFRAVQVPVGNWDQSVFWITNYQGFSASLLAMKELRLAKGLSYPLSAGLLLRDAVEGKWLKSRENGIEPDYCTAFDDRFEEFWQKLRKSFSHRLLANRSREVLQWHFKHPLKNGRAWMLSVSNGTGLVAYGIFLRQDNPAYALKRMRLVDFQALPGSTELLRPILCHALARCRRDGVHMLEAMGFGPEKQQIIDTLSPHRRPLTSWRYFYKAADPQLAECLKQPEVWDPTCFDGDSSL
jgi:hypothetical protein